MPVRISIRYLFVITMVIALVAAAVGYLIKTALGDYSEMHWFIAYTAAGPMALMVVIYWAMTAANYIASLSRTEKPDPEV